MNDNEKSAQAKSMKAVLESGLGIQSIAVVAAFALKKDRAEFLRKIREEIEEFVNSLNDEEKKELQEDMDLMLEQKAEEFADELEGLDDKEKDEVLDVLKQISE